MIKRHHDNFYVKHFEYKKIFKIIWRKVFWPAMCSNIWQYVKKCEICQRIKVSRWRFYESLMALPQPTISFREISLNFIVKLPFNTLNEQVYDSILVVVDCYTWISLYIFITETITTLALIELLRRRVFDHFNYSDRVVSDWGFLFINYYYL